MPQHDQLHRYLFENFAVRGELVTVSETLQQILENHDYPQPVKNVLAELLVATSLLTATLKFDGDITVQLQGDGPMNLAVINGNNNQQMRGVARVQGEIPENADLKTLVGNGYVVITITPSEGERYQGVVGLEGDTLAACLADSFSLWISFFRCSFCFSSMLSLAVLSAYQEEKFPFRTSIVCLFSTSTWSTQRSRKSLSWETRMKPFLRER